ncbi:MAG: hypothetical protein JRD89_03530 [Deltaproteobacteria bacterium]|nr:hypothetical protein [Deltaproteobacteria bacterium]
MSPFRLIIKGTGEEVTDACKARNVAPLRAVELPDRNNTVVVAMADPLELHQWYAGDEQERGLIRAGKPLPPGALLYFQEGAGADAAPNQ